jgi:hypothetical protein
MSTSEAGKKQSDDAKRAKNSKPSAELVALNKETAELKKQVKSAETAYTDKLSSRAKKANAPPASDVKGDTKISKGEKEAKAPKVQPLRVVGLFRVPKGTKGAEKHNPSAVYPFLFLRNHKNKMWIGKGGVEGYWSGGAIGVGEWSGPCTKTSNLARELEDIKVASIQTDDEEEWICTSNPKFTANVPPEPRYSSKSSFDFCKNVGTAIGGPVRSPIVKQSAV